MFVLTELANFCPLELDEDDEGKLRKLGKTILR
jgi:hypothetical protein